MPAMSACQQSAERSHWSQRDATAKTGGAWLAIIRAHESCWVTFRSNNVQKSFSSCKKACFSTRTRSIPSHNFQTTHERRPWSLRFWPPKLVADPIPSLHSNPWPFKYGDQEAAPEIRCLLENHPSARPFNSDGIFSRRSQWRSGTDQAYLHGQCNEMLQVTLTLAYQNLR